MKKREIAYIAVSADKYEWILTCCDTIEELALWANCSIVMMRYYLTYHYVDRNKNCVYLKIKMWCIHATFFIIYPLWGYFYSRICSKIKKFVKGVYVIVFYAYSRRNLYFLRNAVFRPPVFTAYTLARQSTPKAVYHGISWLIPNLTHK